MDGMRVLDVGTCDGFWAFEMERRGADVVAIDLDWDPDLDWPAIRTPTGRGVPRGKGFDLAKEALGSRVERRNLSIYDATPEGIGTFDLVFCGSLLVHLRDAVLAIERIADLCRDLFISVEAYDRWIGPLPLALARYRALRDGAVVFWEPNIRAWRRMLESASFRSVEKHSRLKLRSREGWAVPHVVMHARK
jgi:tRNA (mo5U34)-methyltransferase